ncbi:hypothetical protein LMG29660_02209 [Burkholderia puraquae]|uniref:Uncharacterized protein n=1 Tax=Burkholderia puraquae TaxID=1904757 RepID=A0A6J5DLP6_9BURK|nr:hypothetical protein LMG29660_02209 [Burkholderia puraquae]
MRCRAVAPGPIDCVIDPMPPPVPATTVRAAVMAVRPYGRVMLMGGVGMLGGARQSLRSAIRWKAPAKHCVSFRWQRPG